MMDENEIDEITKEVFEILKKKNKTYGDGNISKIGQLGILTRIEEKTEKLKNMIKNDIIDEESVEDNWKDVVGYGILGLLVKRDKWGK